MIAPNADGTYYTATGEGVTSDKNFPCDETIDCDLGLVCHLENTAQQEGVIDEHVNTCVDFYATTSEGAMMTSSSNSDGSDRCDGTDEDCDEEYVCDVDICRYVGSRPRPDDAPADAATVVEASTPAPSPARTSIATTVLDGGLRHLREV